MIDEPLRVDDATRLRPVCLDDADALAALVDANRTYLREWLPWLDHSRTADDSRTFLRESIEQNTLQSGAVLLIETDGRPCGVVGFNWVVLSNRHCGLGYWLSESHRGRGIMTASVRRLTNYAFDEMRLHRVSIAAATENRRSRAIPERLGFKAEGVLRENEWLYDHFVDHVLYAVLEPEWRA